jgi:hypothetical protein
VFITPPYGFEFLFFIVLVGWEIPFYPAGALSISMLASFSEINLSYLLIGSLIE